MTKLTMKCGDIEVEYEGPEDFLKTELPQLLQTVAKLRVAGPAPVRVAGAAAAVMPVVAPAVLDALSVSTICQKLAVANGPNLIVASALSYLVQGKLKFSKADLKSRSKEATSFYRASYSTNFERTIKTLVAAGSLIHNGGDSYALPDAKGKELINQVSAA